ncbi:IS110 family transposase [Dyadobacter chenhuakuii]|uniref:IS110 family transposase n=1 Tax=Dyadobacter chenhuakuii TaxID=2909339 RepID=A0A9X1QHN5_9BACT|nr:IS110 family transposase [Dyadobacter chenhuakuii]MCF2501044.1 IS110 family transposase [Dyadobacter chenhuakuii]
MEPKIFVGVDISKLTMDLAILTPNQPIRSLKIDNTEDSVRKCLKTLKEEYRFKTHEIVFCAENMGMYCDFLIRSLKNIRVCLESPLQIKRSLGITRGKSDKLDAVRIAEYAKKHYSELKFWEPPRECIQRLQRLEALRKRLVKIRPMLTNGDKIRSQFLRTDERKAFDKLFQKSLSALNEDLEALRLEMESIIAGDERLNSLVLIITSVPCIGKVIATQIIIHTNEFKNINSAKKFASYCGVAPFDWTSGTSLKGRSKVSHIANKEIKASLHLAAMGCLRQKGSELCNYYLRKQKEGKNNMAIINAVRNKLIHRIFACVNNNSIYKPI